MNAIIALCHFCEAHGPCILFCTQAFHQSQDAQLLLDSVPLDHRRPFNSRMEGPQDGDLSSLMHPLPKSTDQCDACRSIPLDQPGYISYDSNAQITYISGQYPEQKQLYSILRQACVRSLNCEVCPGREGPIVFGEDNGCHTLSHTFKLSDSQARGFTRLYSFIIVMTDRVFLINSWPFLVRHFQVLIENIQEKAEKIYSRESEENKLNRSMSSHLHVPDHLRRIRSNPVARSLIELTGDKDAFIYLHKYFVFILKSGGQRMTECIVEGPPQAMAVSDSIVELSDHELREKLDKPVPANEFRVLQFDHQPVFRSIRHLLKILGRDDFPKLAYHIMRGDQLIVRGSDPSTVMSVMNILKELLPESICHIVGFCCEYQESYVSEFLGLSVGVNLPKHIVDSDLHVLLDILPPLKRYYSRSVDDHSSPLFEETDSLEQYVLMVYSAHSSQDQKYSLIIQRLMSLLSADSVSDAWISRAILNLKEEWMNKVKVLYKFSQMYPKDGTTERDERLTRLLRDVLHVQPDELPILLHWRAALRKDYKTHLMQKDHQS